MNEEDTSEKPEEEFLVIKETVIEELMNEKDTSEKPEEEILVLKETVIEELMNEEDTSEKPRYRTMYITYVDDEKCPFPFITRPRITKRKSVDSALNMIANAILKGRGVALPDPFRENLEGKYPEVLELSSDYVGITVPVAVPAGMKPREFRRRFCTDRAFRSEALIQNLGIRNLQS